jgi:hypothetical protein
VTSSLVLTFIHTCMKSLPEHGSIKQPWFCPANPRREFPVSSAHESIKAARGSTCMDVDVDSVEAELNAYTRVQQVPLDTDPLMWWKQHVQEFPHLTRMVRQDLAVPATSASPERLFSSVGLVKSDLRGSLLDSTLIDVPR